MLLLAPFPKAFEGKFTHSPMMIPIFLNSLYVSLGMMLSPSTYKPKQNPPYEEVIRKWTETAKQFFEEEQDLESSQTSLPWS